MINQDRPTPRIYDPMPSSDLKEDGEGEEGGGEGGGGVGGGGKEGGRGGELRCDLRPERVVTGSSGANKRSAFRTYSIHIHTPHVGTILYERRIPVRTTTIEMEYRGEKREGKTAKDIGILVRFVRENVERHVRHVGSIFFFLFLFF